MTVEELKVILELETRGFNKQAESTKKALNDTGKTADSVKDRVKRIFDTIFGSSKNALSGISNEANKARDNITRSVDATAKECDKASSAIEKTKEAFRGLKTAALVGRIDSGLIDLTPEAKEYVHTVITCEDAIKSLKETMDGMDPEGDAFRKMQEEVSNYQQKIDEAKQKLANMPKFGTHALFEDKGSISNIKTLKAQLSGLRNYMQGIRTGFASVFQQTPVGQFATKVGSAFTGVKRFIIGAKNDIGSFGKKVIGVASHFKPFGRYASRAGSGIKNFIKSALGIGSIIVLFNKMKAAMKEGFSNLSKYSSQTRSDLARLKGSLTQVKDSLAVAFAPILTAVAPLIQTLVNYITAACNALAMFFGALTGQQTVTVAKSGLGDIAAGAAGAADATNAASGAAEDYKRTLMGFDQINKLDDNSSSGGSGGSGGVGGAAGFATEEVTNTFSSWADKVKEAWQNAEFTEIGAIIAQKINSAMDKIDWESIRAKCNKVATSIGTFINGFVAKLDWGEVGNNLSQGLITIFDTLSTFLQTVDWQQIGRSIVLFFKGIDWAGLFASAWELLGSIGGAIFGVLKGAWDEAVAGVKNYFSEKIEEAGGDVIAGICQGIVDGIKNIGSWIKKNIFDPVIKGFKKAFGIASPSKEMKKMGGHIIEGLLSGIENGLSDIISWFKNLPQKIKKAVGTIVTNVEAKLSSWKDALKDKIVGFQSRLDTWKDNLKSKVVPFQAGLTSWRDNLKDKILSFVAKLTDKKDCLTAAQRQISITGKVDKIIGKGGAVLEVKAEGGLYQNGHWKPITAAAGGGAFSMGQMFVAREAGPELVGTIGGHTAVMNNDQIVSSVADGVYKAVLSAFSHTGGDKNVNIVLEGDAQGLFRVIRTEARNYTNATGLAAFPV